MYTTVILFLKTNSMHFCHSALIELLYSISCTPDRCSIWSKLSIEYIQYTLNHHCHCKKICRKVSQCNVLLHTEYSIFIFLSLSLWVTLQSTHSQIAESVNRAGIHFQALDWCFSFTFYFLKPQESKALW